MPTGLSFDLVPREESHSAYEWMNIELGPVRVGKVRGLIDGQKLTICTINVFPEYERRGYARAAIEKFKNEFCPIVADRVRPTAIGFWERMGFVSSGDGGYIWEKSRNRTGGDDNCP